MIQLAQACPTLGGRLIGSGGMAILAGALLTLSFAPFHFYPLAIMSPALLLWLWQGQTPRRAAYLGGLFGLGWFGSGIYWINISLHQYGHAPLTFALLATFVVVLIMALYPAVVGYVLARWTQPGLLQCLLLAPALWTLLEWVRSWLFTGFPWLSLGYSQTDSPLAGMAPYLGVFGVSWAVMLSAGLLLCLLRGERRGPCVAGVLGLWLGIWGLGQIDWVQAQGEPLRVSLVQGNISQDQKWQPEVMDKTLAHYVELSLEATENSDVIIWPETAIPGFYQDMEAFVAALQTEAERSHTDYLSGIPSGSWENGVFYNSVISLGRSQGFYHKRRLLPFGEYLPLRGLLMFFRDFVQIPMADFNRGAVEQPLLQVGGHPVGVSICFEAAFGSEIRLALPAARFLVNVSNDAWFGESLAPHQHLQIARMRALETGRYMARATNTGVSAIIDQQGKITTQSDLFVSQVLTGTVQPFSGITPYVRVGDWAIVGFSGFLLVFGWIFNRRQKAV